MHLLFLIVVTNSEYVHCLDAYFPTPHALFHDLKQRISIPIPFIHPLKNNPLEERQKSAITGNQPYYDRLKERQKQIKPLVRP